eukprot:1151430-Pelagomonas_calceolata.AAC.3
MNLLATRQVVVVAAAASDDWDTDDNCLGSADSSSKCDHLSILVFVLVRTHDTQHTEPQVIARDAMSCILPPSAQANPIYQALILSQRMFVNNMRNVGMFWIRLLILCICMGTIFFDLGNTWKETFSRAAMLFFVAVSGAHHQVQLDK